MASRVGSFAEQKIPPSDEAKLLGFFAPQKNPPYQGKT